MTFPLENLADSNAKDAFARASVAQRRPAAPFSLRLSADQRKRLTEEAADIPLGSYIKAKLFDQGVQSIRRRRSGLTVADKQALARALALLGQSRISSNLNQLAHAANIGALPLTPEVEADLCETLVAVRDMRNLLVQALGLKGGEAP